MTASCDHLEFPLEFISGIISNKRDIEQHWNWSHFIESQGITEWLCFQRGDRMQTEDVMTECNFDDLDDITSSHFGLVSFLELE